MMMGQKRHEAAIKMHFMSVVSSDSPTLGSCRGAHSHIISIVYSNPPCLVIILLYIACLPFIYHSLPLLYASHFWGLNIAISPLWGLKGWFYIYYLLCDSAFEISPEWTFSFMFICFWVVWTLQTHNAIIPTRPAFYFIDSLGGQTSIKMPTVHRCTLKYIYTVDIYITKRLDMKVV